MSGLAGLDFDEGLGPASGFCNKLQPILSGCQVVDGEEFGNVAIAGQDGHATLVAQVPAAAHVDRLAGAFNLLLKEIPDQLKAKILEGESWTMKKFEISINSRYQG